MAEETQAGLERSSARTERRGGNGAGADPVVRPAEVAQEVGAGALALAESLFGVAPALSAQRKTVMGLASRRTRAWADYFDQVASASEPAELFAALNKSWSRFMHDYQDAGAAATEPLVRWACSTANEAADGPRPRDSGTDRQH